jgi:hypothetical protein
VPDAAGRMPSAGELSMPLGGECGGGGHSIIRGLRASTLEEPASIRLGSTRLERRIGAAAGDAACDINTALEQHAAKASGCCSKCMQPSGALGCAQAYVE